MNIADMNETELTSVLRGDGEMVTERLDHWAKVSGDRVFFYYGEDDIKISFADFARRTDRIAGNLARMGIGKGDRVSVLTRNPMINALLMFGIWKAGGVYSPVNFAYTGRLLTYQFNDTRPALVVTDSHLLPAVNEVAGTLEEVPALVVYAAPEGVHDYLPDPVDPDPAFACHEWAALERDCPAPDITLSFDDPANLIYTSGTTGPAKGVLQPHRWMATYTIYLRVLTTPDDVIYNDLPMYHVGGAVANVCRAAWVGCEVAVWDRFSPTAFWGRIAQRKVTTAILLDVMIPWLVNAEPREDDRQNTLNKIHMQPLSLQHNDFARRFGIDFVTAGFGQTESGMAFWTVIEETAQGEGTPDALYRGLDHAQLLDVAKRYDMVVTPGSEDTRKGLMGLPSPFVEVAVRNELDEECPPEVAGHLTLRPRLPGMLLHCYLGKPEATVAAFRNLWFHTGDAVLKGNDGMYYFVDRLGDRIRVRGENLSSFQVEDMINQHPQVQMSAAVGLPSQEGDEDDVAVFVVPLAGENVEAAAIHEFAAQTMPKYMRPTHVRVVDDLPKTPTNKVEKYKLRQSILAELKTS